MRHPADGVLRRLLDEPAGVADADREHVGACGECRHRLAAIRADADLVQAALTTDTGADVDLAPAWRRLSAATTTGRDRRTAAPPRPGRFRSARRRPVVAGGAGPPPPARAGPGPPRDRSAVIPPE